MELSKKHCVPCEGDAMPLDKAAAAEYLKIVDNWQLNDSGTKISKSFKFKDFTVVREFINTVADIADNEGHHPDVCFGYDYVDVSLMTHAIGGLSENDFILAAKIDQI